jgi:16S rRNA (uracil1498-N3)-methyltransferase
LQRYFITQEQLNGNKVSINGEDARHIHRVMRMDIGDKVICTISDHRSALCELVEITNETVLANVVEWLEEQKELPIQITIAQGLPKGDKLELIVQKSTELGAHAFLPFKAERSIVKWDDKKVVKKVERLEKITKEAAEQSHRTIIPTCFDPVSFKGLLEKSKEYDFTIFAYEEAAKNNEQNNLVEVFNQAKHGASILVVIGPEGGISDNEASILIEHGFIPCGLGPRILRTETASLYILAAASYHFELLR